MAKTLAPCPHCGLRVIQTGDNRHPCGYCGKPLTPTKETDAD